MKSNGKDSAILKLNKEKNQEYITMNTYGFFRGAS